MNATRKFLFTFLVVGLLMPCLSFAQEKSDLVKRIEAVSRKAKSVETATGFSEVITECDALLESELDKDSHRDCLKTLIAWALDKRGVTRTELSTRFQKAGSDDQATLVLDQAIEDFDKSIQHDKSRWQTPMHRGTSLTELGRYVDAEKDFTVVLNIKPNSTSAHFNRAEVRFQLGKHAAAVADYDAVLKSDPEDVQSISGRAHCYLAMKEFESAVKDYDRVVSKMPKDGWALANRADANVAMNQWKEARSDLLAATELQRNGEFCRRLAWLLATCPNEAVCNGEQSLAMARQAIEITGENVENLDTLAAALAAAGKFERARDVHSRVIAMRDSTDPASAVKQAAYENNERYQEKFDQ